MCGIYGFQITPGHEISQYEATIISLNLAFAMENRGRDSYGGVSIPMIGDEDKDAHVHRGLGRATSNGGALFKTAVSSRCFLGHTRAATKGAVTIPNAHPFRIGDVLGVHNGVINNHDTLNNKYDRKFEVDSMHAFAHIDEGKPLDELVGYGTFFWLRGSEYWNNIYFARTIAGSLSVAKFYRDKHAERNSKDYFMIIWASEVDAIARIAQLLDVQWYPLNVESETVYRLSEGQVFNTNRPFKFGNYITTSRRIQQPSCYDRDEEEYLMFEGMFGQHHTHGPACLLLDKDNKPRKLSRNEKKALKKQQRKERQRKQEAIRKREWMLDPVIENIATGYGLSHCYVPVSGTSGETTKQFLCPDCKCLLRYHSWGCCPNADLDAPKGRDKQCKIKDPRYACEVPAVSVCSDCGHYLLEGIHQESNAMMVKIVECTVCNHYCAPENMVIDPVEDEDLKEEVDEITEQESGHKPTEIILASAAVKVLQRFEQPDDEEVARKLSELNGTM